MQSQKLSISIPQQQFDFIEQYQIERHYKTRSEVIKDALYLLQQAYLAGCYQSASAEIDSDFDPTLLDGLDDNETW